LASFTDFSPGNGKRADMKRIHTFAAALLLSTLLAGCGDSPEQRLARARDSFSTHEYRKARLDLASVLKEDPANAAVLELLARVNLASQDAVGAETMLDRLKAAGRTPADYPLLMAEIDVMRGRHDEAIKRLEGNQSAEAYRIRALALLGKGDTAGAEQAFAAGARAGGPRGRLLGDYAHFVLATGDKERAQALATQAMAEKPAQLGALLANAEIAQVRGQAMEALKFYDTALIDYPESRAALIGKIAILGEIGRINEIRTLVDDALKENPKDLDYIYLQARLAAVDNNWPKVREILQPHEGELVGTSPGRLLYAEALLQIGQPEQARVMLTEILRSQPGHRQARFLLGRSQLASGDAKAALDTLQPIATRPDATPQELALIAKASQQAGDPSATALAGRAAFPTAELLAGEFAKGDAAMRARNWMAAIKAYERIMGETDGRNVLVLNNLALAYNQVGNKDKALDFAERALKLAPDNASVMDTMGWLLHQAGKDRDRAVALLREAARRAPGNRNIAEHLAMAERG